jgi:hypothetical protein
MKFLVRFYMIVPLFRKSVAGLNFLCCLCRRKLFLLKMQPGCCLAIAKMPPNSKV